MSNSERPWRQEDRNLRGMGSDRKWAGRMSRSFSVQGDFPFHWPDYLFAPPDPPPYPSSHPNTHPPHHGKKYGILFSLTHLTLITGCICQATYRSWWEVAAYTCECTCVCACTNTYFHHHLTLSPAQCCHYGAFPAYRGQLSHHEISPGPSQHTASPPLFLRQHRFPHQHLLIRQTWHSHLRLGG